MRVLQIRTTVGVDDDDDDDDDDDGSSTNVTCP